MLSCISMSADELISSGAQPDLSPTSGDQLVLNNFQQITCFSSTHAMHAAFAIIIAIVLLMMTLVVVFLFFESRKSHTNSFAK